MSVENKENMNEINLEKKPLETLKDNLKKENISDIKIKNQSIQNNTNSYSKSFDSENKDNKEKDDFNGGGINIIDGGGKKESKFKKRKEEIKMLIYNKKNKLNLKNKKQGLIQRVNKKPDLEPHSKFNFSNTLKKINNKSIEKKAKELLNNDNKESKNEKEKNKFITKLKEIEVKIEEINEHKIKKNQEENKLEYKYNKELNEENFVNLNNNKNDKENFINFNFDIKMQNGSSENKYQELKKLYFYDNKFDFDSMPKKYTNRNNNNSSNKIKNYNNSYKKKEEFTEIYKSYNSPRLNHKNKNNQNMIRVINDSDNFNNILDKLDKFEENKNETIFKNYLFNKNKNMTMNDLSTDKSSRRNKSDFGMFKSVSIEKSSKLKNMIDDVYDEIKEINYYSLKRNFSKKISNAKINLKYSNYYRKDKNSDLNNINSINQYGFKKSNDLNFDDLLKLCSKRNLKCLIKNTKMNF